MFIMTKKYFSSFITIVITVMMTVIMYTSLACTAFAFNDVPEGYPYGESIEAAYTSGIAGGTGENTFSPNRETTLQEGCTFLLRAYNNGSGTDDSCLSAYKMGWVNLPNPYNPRSPFDKGSFYTALFQAAEINVYDPKLYDANSTVTMAEHIVSVAKELGLCPAGALPSDAITRGEAVHAIMNAKDVVYTVQEPPILSSFPIRLETPGWNAGLMALMEIPKNIRTRFQNEGWTLVFGTSSTKSYEAEHPEYDAIIGLTDPNSKSIHIANSEAVVHEFGHFLDLVTGWSKNEGATIFQTESKNLQCAKLLDEYGTSNTKEFFAEVFAFYIQNPSSADRARLQSVCPQTYAYLQNLETQGWVSTEVESD